MKKGSNSKETKRAIDTFARACLNGCCRFKATDSTFFLLAVLHGEAGGAIPLSDRRLLQTDTAIMEPFLVALSIVRKKIRWQYNVLAQK